MHVPLYTPAFAILAVLLALGFAALFVRDLEQGHRYPAIDGLRGVLAPLVFTHHGLIWFYYARHQPWVAPASELYINLGRHSVVFFFMITGFLFSSKLIEARARPMDWTRLYASRVLRLTPLYLCAVAAVFFVVAVESKFRLLVPPTDLLRQVAHWGLFTARRGAVDINGYPHSSHIIAGVTWTLAYEWWFYCSLPVLGLVLGVKRARGWPVWFILGAIVMCSVRALDIDTQYLSPFIGGIAAAVVVHAPAVHRRLSFRGADAVTLGLLAVAVALPTSAWYPALWLLAAAFILMACGVDVFGVLKGRGVRAMSAISYGFYLWHGIVLFVVMHYVVGLERAATLSPAEHLAVLLSCIPVVVGMSALTYRWVEMPAMGRLPALMRWWRTRFAVPAPVIVPTPVVPAPVIAPAVVAQPPADDPSRSQ